MKKDSKDIAKSATAGVIVVAVLGLHSGGTVPHTVTVSATAGTATGTAWLYPLMFFAVVILMVVLAACLIPLML